MWTKDKHVYQSVLVWSSGAEDEDPIYSAVNESSSSDDDYDDVDS